MIDTLHCRQYASDKAAPIRLNAGFRSDLAWWRAFASEWNGVSFLPNPVHLPAVEMASDASGVVEVGTGTQLAWDQRSQPLPIASKELIPIILGCAAWGHSWQARRVICHCDNHVVVAAMRTRTSRDKALMHLIRCLVFVEAHFQCYLSPVYINAHANYLADDLSRNNLPSFLSKVPHASRRPVAVSAPLLDLLLDTHLDWTSPIWSRQFNYIFNRA
jgi:hypothetical protein